MENTLQVQNIGRIKFVHGNKKFQGIEKIGEKTCSKCMKSKLLDRFYNDNYGVSGKNRWCKECTSNGRKQLLAKSTGRTREEIENKGKIVDGKKKCPKCNEWKLVNNFSKNNRCSSGLYVYCRGCVININKGSYFKESRRIKLICMIGYGGKCTCCGERKLSLLTIEHIRYKGHKLIYENNVTVLMKKLIELNFPVGYTVLCWNCNMSTKGDSPCEHSEKYKQYYSKRMAYPYNKQKELDELERKWHKMMYQEKKA